MNSLSPEFLAVQPGIFAGESGGDYNALFGYSNRPGQPFAGVNLTDMTVAEVAAFTDPNGPYAQWVRDQIGYVATPTGAYQVVGTTLRNAIDGMGLTGNERYDPAMQDRIGQYIYETQGTGAWEGYQPGVTEMPRGSTGGNASPAGGTYATGASTGYGTPQNALDPALYAQAVQQARQQQAVNALMQTFRTPIYDFKLAGGV